MDHPEKPDSFWLGVGGGLGVQFALAAILIALSSGWVFFVGLFQFVIIIPAAIILKRLGRKATLKGLIVSTIPILFGTVVVYGLIASGILLM